MSIPSFITFEITDRYNGNPPSSLRICRGPCEGMGSYPDMGNFQEKYGGDIDKVPFLTCPECHGTGRVAWTETVRRLPRWFIGGLRFAITGPSRGSHNKPLDFWIRLKVAFLPDLGWRPR
jgi:hypothetical protein